MKNFKSHFLFLLLFVNLITFSQTINDSIKPKQHSLYGGIRVEKAMGFYYSSGAYLEFSSNKLLNQRLNFGLTYVTSRLGTAFQSNAIPFWQLTANVNLMLRKKKHFKICFRLNGGYAQANYHDPIFDDLPQSSPIVSFEPGLLYDFKFPLRIGTGLGYNFITGNGITGLGVIYPVYFQFNAAYRFKL